MSNILIILCPILLILLIAGWLIRTRNDFVAKEIRVEEGLSGIEVALAKRYDLLTNLLQVTKGYIAYEKEILTKIVELRKGMTVEELNAANEEIDAFRSRLFAVVEGYPELRGSEVCIKLMHGIHDAEEHLQAARRLYNTNVTAYNTAIRVFPASLLAGGRQPKAFFSAEEKQHDAVSMTF